jgi:hypothetical protein
MPRPQSSRERRGPRQGHDLRGGLSPTGPTTRTRPSHWRDRASARLIWKILHERVRYDERGPAVSAQATQIRTRKMIRALRGLGYHVELTLRPTGE